MKNKSSKLKKIILREDLFAITKETYTAIILGRFIYWLDKTKDFDNYIEEERQRGKVLGKEIDFPLTKGWIYKKADDIIEECMLDISKTTTMRIIDKLIKAGYLKQRTNPRFKFDKVYQYRVDIIKVCEDIKSLGYSVDEYRYLFIRQTNDDETSEVQNETSEVQNETAIPYITSYITNNNKEKDKSFSKKSEKDELFEECWKAYRRKGSKAKSKIQWEKIPQDEKEKIIIHIKHYVSTRELQFQQDFERYLKNKIYETCVVQNNNVLYDPDRNNNKSNEYNPICDGISLMWNDYAKCFMTPFDITTITDGYNDDNRPDGAIVMWRGYKYRWNRNNKTWLYD